MGKNDLVKTLRMNYLFDFYQTLLTEKQKKLFGIVLFERLFTK